MAEAKPNKDEIMDMWDKCLAGTITIEELEDYEKEKKENDRIEFTKLLTANKKSKLILQIIHDHIKINLQSEFIDEKIILKFSGFEIFISKKINKLEFTSDLIMHLNIDQNEKIKSKNRLVPVEKAMFFIYELKAFAPRARFKYNKSKKSRRSFIRNKKLIQRSSQIKWRLISKDARICHKICKEMGTLSREKIKKSNPISLDTFQKP